MEKYNDLIKLYETYNEKTNTYNQTTANVSKMKKYIVETNEIKACYKCFAMESGRGRSEHDFCGLIDGVEDSYIGNNNVKLPNFPLKPLNPKQLEWEDSKDGIVSKNTEIKYELFEDWNYDDYQLTLAVEMYIVGVYFDTEIDLAINGILSLEDGKKFCQEHYNKLFYEMIGE